MYIEFVTYDYHIVVPHGMYPYLFPYEWSIRYLNVLPSKLTPRCTRFYISFEMCVTGLDTYSEVAISMSLDIVSSTQMMYRFLYQFIVFHLPIFLLMLIREICNFL